MHHQPLSIISTYYTLFITVMGHSAIRKFIKQYDKRDFAIRTRLQIHQEIL